MGLCSRRVHRHAPVDGGDLPGAFVPNIHTQSTNVHIRTEQIGDIFHTFSANLVPSAHSLSSILFSPNVVLKLVFLTFISLVPVLYREKLKQLLGNEESAVVEPTMAADSASPRSSTSSTRTHQSRFSIQWWLRSTDDQAVDKEMAEIRLGMA